MSINENNVKSVKSQGELGHKANVSHLYNYFWCSFFKVLTNLQIIFFHVEVKRLTCVNSISSDITYMHFAYYQV